MKKKAEEYSADDAAAPPPMGGDAAASDTDCLDVFLSFGGFCNGVFFVESLYRSLVDAGIRVFRKVDEFQVGEEVGRKILRAIDGAKICIPIFSKFYASDARCLRVVAAMVDSKAKSGGGKTIIPIFFDVEPRDVMLETPLYRGALSMNEKIYGSKAVSAWEDALKQVASLPGWVTGFSSSTADIRKLIGAITVKLKEVLKKDEAKEPVGFDKQVEDVMDLLDLEVSDEVRKKDEAKEPVVLIGKSYRESPVVIDKQVEDMMDLLDLEVGDILGQQRNNLEVFGVCKAS